MTPPPTAKKISRERKIVLLNLLNHGATRERVIELGGIRFTIVEHDVGWHIPTAQLLIKKYDGYVDGFAISGIQKRLIAGRNFLMHPVSLSLMRAAVKTPIYLADYCRELFAEWTIQKLLKDQPQFFQGKSVLFHCAVASSLLPRIADAASKIRAADPMLLPGIPVTLKNLKQIEAYAWSANIAGHFVVNNKINPRLQDRADRLQKFLVSKIQDADIFVTLSNLIEQLSDLSPLKGKVVIIDFLTEDMRTRLEAVEPAQVVVFTPEHPQFDEIPLNHYSVFAALIDQIRIAHDSPLSFDEFLLRWIQDSNVKPRSFKHSKGFVRRCAFIVHPLNTSQLWQNAKMDFMLNTPKLLQALGETAAARVPVFKYGKIEGIVSQHTGQEVVCDLYAIPATPKQLLSMNEELLYKRMVQAAELARSHGANMMGLGAYTKVVGDAGVTIARRAPIPVTNGNSYSASATLWAAREMLERMGLVKMADAKRARAKAMIVGATGSIGRVSALLVSLAVDELVLVATRPDKLLELRQEVLELSPTIRVHVSTNPDPDLPNTDLIVTATSNQSGKILDIMQVKPGAVICDCSRPLDIGADEAAKRPDVLVIESGEINLPGDLKFTGSIGLPYPSVYACLAETVLLTLEGRYESFSLSKHLSLDRVKEIYRIGIKHGAKLSAICGPGGPITDADIEACRSLAMERLPSWRPGLKTSAPEKTWTEEIIGTESETEEASG
jgi:predicted amino acid dehydrogenase